MCLGFALNQFKKYKCHFQTLRSNHNLPRPLPTPPPHSSTPQPKMPSPPRRTNLHNCAHPNILRPLHRHQLLHLLQISTLPTLHSAPPTPPHQCLKIPPHQPHIPPHRPLRHNRQLKHLNPEPQRLLQKRTRSVPLRTIELRHHERQRALRQPQAAGAGAGCGRHVGEEGDDGLSTTVPKASA